MSIFDPHDNYWYDDILLGNQADESRYTLTEEHSKNPKVFCCACNLEIGSLEMHVLKTISYGWHINSDCLQNMEDWLFEEFKKREGNKWSRTL